MRGFVAYGSAAPFTSVRYYITAARVRLGFDGHKCAAASIGSVTGVYIHVHRVQAKGAVIA